MKDRIRHEATVTEVLEQAVRVTLHVESACAACHAKSQCAMGEGKEKELVIETPMAEAFTPGESVWVDMDRVMGLKAVWWVYILPFVAVMSALLILLQWGVSELIAGSTALGMLILYYLGMYLLRERIAREITFSIHKVS
ncbi:MAG: SoxR reducing system RseC family protein [Alistipes sp.]|nr:SoxR reducing system RseC family protein [Alistipes sp.]